MKNWCILLFDCDGELFMSHTIPGTTTLDAVYEILESDERTCDYEVYPIVEEIEESPVEDFGNLPLKP